MSSNTTNLGLLKKNPTTDGSDTFNIETMLNENWDKIDAITGSASATNKGVVKVGSGIDVDVNGVISVPSVTIPVLSVNTKTGTVVLVPSDIGATSASDFTTHVADNTKHVSKDGTLQTGLNSDLLDGYHLDDIKRKIRMEAL